MNKRCTKRGFTPTPILAPFRFCKIFLGEVSTFVAKSTITENASETKKQHQNRCRGFTVMEMMVSIALFTIVLFIATSAFLSVVRLDRKARGTRIAMDNLNVALEDMTRRIKTGTTYHCGSGAGTLDCSLTPGTTFEFTDQKNIRTRYSLATGDACEPPSSFSILSPYTNKQCILRKTGDATSIPINAPSAPITSPEINVTDMHFLVSGSTSFATDKTQPMVVITVGGVLGSGATATTFKAQTAVTQRVYDN